MISEASPVGWDTRQIFFVIERERVSHKMSESLVFTNDFKFRLLHWI